MREPMSPERIAEIRARSQRHPIHAEVDMPEVLAEIDRLRVEADRLRLAWTSARRGRRRARAEADGLEALALASAVKTKLAEDRSAELRADVERLEAENKDLRDKRNKDAAWEARLAEARLHSGDVTHSWHEAATAMQKERDQLAADVDRLTAERDRAHAKLQRVWLARAYRTEDNREFVLTSDLLNAIEDEEAAE